MSLPLKCPDLFFREIWRFIFPKADVKKTVQVITDQPVEAVPVEVKERCCALDRIQPLRVECFTNYRVVFGIIQPSQFIEFADGEINITTPNPVNINCSKANIVAPDGVDMTTPLLHVIGGAIKADKDITDNADTQASTVKQLRDAHNDHDHDVKLIQTGSSTRTSEKTSEQV